MIALLLGALVAGTVTLRPSAEIAGPTIELAEVADVRGADADETRRLSELSIGPAPATGNVRGVRRDDVTNALRAAGLTATIAGHALCRATPKVESIAASELEDAAKSALSKLFAGRDVEIEVVRAASDLSVPAAELRRELEADLGRREALPGSWSVPIDVKVDGTRVQTAWIALDVRLYEEQPVATRDLRRGDAIDASCWTPRRARVDSTGPKPAAVALLAGSVCVREVAAGACITEFDVRREMLVRAGDLVELEVVRGPIRARSRAVARGQGAVGDRVEVQSGEGQRRLVGTVVQRGLVRVELASAPRNER